MKRSSRFCALLVLGATLMTGCTSVGNLGIVTKPSANNADRLKSGVTFEELGPVEGSGCRHQLVWLHPDLQCL